MSAQGSGEQERGEALELARTVHFTNPRAETIRLALLAAIEELERMKDTAHAYMTVHSCKRGYPCAETDALAASLDAFVQQSGGSAHD